MPEQITEVAVAIFQRADGSFLLSSRPQGKPYAGFWEFPGGKIEAGESVRAALVRELVEELNVTITEASPWFSFIMRYTHATVRLNCWRVRAWQGELRGMEGQEFCWQSLDGLSADAMTVSPTLPGCVPIFAALCLGETYLITNASEMGAENYLKKLRAVFSAIASNTAPALKFGGFIYPRLIQVREKKLPADALKKFARDVIAIGHEHGARVLINSDVALALHVKADGVHLTSAQLRDVAMRPDFELVGASTHTRAELARAAELKCDFAVLGPVKVTASHPNAKPMGWDAFAAAVDATPIPCFALGGLSRADLHHAIAHGAQGVAVMRGFTSA